MLTPTPSWLFFGFLSSVAWAAPAQQRLHGLTNDATAFSKLTFDYLIVGGGTAGLTLATRLSEDPRVTVGVIEAGDAHPDEPLINTPGNFGHALGNPVLDWGFHTTPQANAGNRTIPVNRGKMLGGSSGLNFMIWHRASTAEYDSWAKLGAKGWDWNGLFPYFKKVETVVPGPANVFPNDVSSPPSGTDSSVYGRHGQVQVGFNNFYYEELGSSYVEAFNSLGGAPINLDPNNGDNTGIWNSARNVDVATGNRSYALNAYFLPVQQRTNLLVLESAQASKVNFGKPSSGSIQATGVSFLSGGKTFSAKASREVVLSAGSVQSPQLLELSGIGNANLLRSLGITPLIDNPAVGENLQDHTLQASAFALKNDSHVFSQFTYLTNATLQAEHEELYIKNHTGLQTYTLTDISFSPASTFVNSSELSSIIAQLEDELAKADITTFHRAQANEQLRLLKEDKVGQIELAFNPGSTGATVANPGKPLVAIVVFGSRPFSRGSIHISTTDPLTPPTINPNFLQFSFDRQIAVAAMQKAKDIASAQPLASFLDGPLNPPAGADLDEFFTNNFSTEWHPIGTASLGPKGNGGVVDENLLVYGTKNLRVVDASIIPLHIAAHPTATIFAIAEKAADIIKRR